MTSLWTCTRSSYHHCRNSIYKFWLD